MECERDALQLVTHATKDISSDVKQLDSSTKGQMTMITRRQALRRALSQTLGATALTAASDPVSVMLRLVSGQTRSAKNGTGIGTGTAFAQGQSGQMGANKRYLFFQMPGAPARWVYDLFLTPYGEERFERNPAVGTCFSSSGGRYTGIDYRTTEAYGIQVPYLWGIPIPKSGGGTRDGKELIQHLIAIQGIHTGNAGHPGSQILHQRPLGATQSVLAMLADVSPAAIAAININTSQFEFRSRAGKSPLGLSSNNRLLEQLASPFQPKFQQNYAQKRAQIQDDLTRTIEALNAQALGVNPNLNTLVQDAMSAQALIEAGFGNIGSDWETLTTKYRTLIERSFDQTTGISRINDRPVGSANANDRDDAYSNGNSTLNQDDLRSIYRDNTVQIQSMAFHFAATEYIMRRDLCRSLSMRLSGLRCGSFRPSFDEHSVGAMTSVWANVFYFRALIACQLELVDTLKDIGVWQDTVINVAGEFNRNAKIDLSGSDHGWRGASVALYSGAVREPLILGSLTNDGSQRYRGMWGMGATDPVLNRPLSLGDFAATLATLLGVPSPVTAAQSLVIPQGEGWLPIVPRTSILS